MDDILASTPFYSWVDTRTTRLISFKQVVKELGLSPTTPADAKCFLVHIIEGSKSGSFRLVIKQSGTLKILDASILSHLITPRWFSQWLDEAERKQNTNNVCELLHAGAIEEVFEHFWQDLAEVHDITFQDLTAIELLTFIGTPEAK